VTLISEVRARTGLRARSGSEAAAVAAGLGSAGWTARAQAIVAGWSVVIALALILLVGGLASEVFLTSDNLTEILKQASPLVIVAVGQTFVMGTAGIDLSISAMIQVGSALLGVAITHEWGVAAGIAAVLSMGAVVGMLIGVVIAKGKVNDFIVTLGAMSIGSGFALVMSDAKPVQVTDTFLLRLSTGEVGPISYLIIVAIVVVLIAHIVLRHTRFGTYLLALGGNTDAALEMGLSRTRIKIAVYGISGFLAGLAAVLISSRLGAADPSVGDSYLLSSVAAAVLGGVSLFGGRASILGACTGAIVLTALLNLLNVLAIAAYYQPIAIGVVVVLSAWLRRFELR
jgi:ribose/xylose/arabinose/galactoside ABC-type transport system permease subunit